MPLEPHPDLAPGAIQHIPHRPVIIHADFLAICRYDACQAAILSVIERFMNYRMKPQRELVTYLRTNAPEQLAALAVSWWWMLESLDALADELLGLYATAEIAAALDALTLAGFLVERIHHTTHNKQYQIQIREVQDAIDSLDEGGSYESDITSNIL